MAGGFMGRLAWGTEVDPSGLDRGIADVEAKVQAAMSKIEHSEATASIRAETRDLDVKIADATARLKRLDAEKASIDVELDTSEFDTEMAALRARIKLLQASRIEIGVRLKNADSVVRETNAFSKALAGVHSAQADAEADAKKATAALDKQRLATLRSAAEVERLRGTYYDLQRTYSRLRGSGGFFGRTGAQEAELRRTGAEMKYTAERVRQLGGSLRNLDRDAHSGNIFQRLFGAFQEMRRTDAALETFSKRIAGARVNLGPFSFKLGSLLPIMATLAPVIVDAAGALTALTGSLAAATTGLAYISAAGFAGFALSAGGALAAIHPLITDLKTAKTTSTALTTATLKYGKGSDQAKTAQEAFNNTLKNMSPEAAKIEKSWTSLKTAFASRTGGIRTSFAQDVTKGISAARTLLPTFARDATHNFAIASKGWDQWMNGLKSAEAKNILGNIMENFGKSLPSIMHGLGEFATAFGRIASAASNFLGSFTHGFDRVGASFANWAGDSEHLNSVMQDITHQTHSWFDLLGATGRLLTTIFMGGSHAGESMVQDLTKTFRGWNRTLKSQAGQDNMASFFQDAVDNSEQFIGVLRRLTTILFDFSRALQPVSAGVLALANWLGDIGHAAAQIAPLRHALELLGVAIAAAFVTNKIKGWYDVLFGAGSVLRALAVKMGLATAAEEGLAVAQGETAAAATTATTAIEAETVALAELSAEQAGIAGAFIGSAGAAEGAAARTVGAAGLSTAAIEGTGAAAGGLLGPLALVGSVGVAAFGILSAEADAAEAKAKALKHALKSLKIPARNLPGEGAAPLGTGAARHIEIEAHAAGELQGNLKKVSSAYRGNLSSVEDITAKTRAYAQAVKDHGVYSIQAARAQNDLRDAEHRSARAEAALTGAMHGTQRVAQIGINQAKLSIEARKKDIAENRREVQAAGVKVRSLKALYASDKTLNALQATISERLNERAMAELGVQRIMQGTQPISAAAAQSVGRLARAYKSVPSVQKFLIKTNSASAVAHVAGVANKLTDLGHKKAVVNIIGNANSANQAFEQLNRKLAQVNQHDAVVKIKEDGSTAVMARLSQILGYKLPPKLQKILGDNRDALGKIEQVIQQRIGNKTFSVIASVGGALSSISSVIGALGSIPRLITTVLKTTKGNAEGGVGNSGARSQKITRPQYMVGEEAPAHPEYVIATNPAYRDQNLDYWAMAGHAIGVPGFKKGGVPSPNPRGSKYDRDHALLNFLSGQYDVDRRQYDDDLAAGRKPRTSLRHLIHEKQHMLKVEDDLRDVVAGMLNRQKHTMKHLKHHEHRLKHHVLDNLESKLKDLGKHHPTGDKAKADLQKKKDDVKKKIDHAKQELQSTKRHRASLIDNYPTLYDEWKHQIPVDMRNLREDIRQLKDERSGATEAKALEQTAAGQARYQFLQEFGGNIFSANGAGFAETGRFGTGGAGFGLTPGAFQGPLAAAAASTAPAAPSAPVSTSKVTNVTNNYLTQPEDPHTWSKALQYELAAGS